MAERLKATVLKTVSPERARGFESHSLRHPQTPLKQGEGLDAPSPAHTSTSHGRPDRPPLEPKRREAAGHALKQAVASEPACPRRARTASECRAAHGPGPRTGVPAKGSARRPGPHARRSPCERMCPAAWRALALGCVLRSCALRLSCIDQQTQLTRHSRPSSLEAGVARNTDLCWARNQFMASISLVSAAGCPLDYERERLKPSGRPCTSPQTSPSRVAHMEAGRALPPVGRGRPVLPSGALRSQPVRGLTPACVRLTMPLLPNPVITGQEAR